MKKFLVVIISFMTFTITEFAQLKEYETRGEFIPKIITHEKTAQWPPQSFYQRKDEWQWIVDSTWGPGVSKTQKQQIFNTYANLIHNNFALFHRLTLDWDSLRTFWFSKITDNTSTGGLHQIMSHLAWTLKDGHSASWNVAISHLPLNPGTPLFLIPCWVITDVSHFGARLTANNEGKIFVLRAIENHPLGLEPGDEIIGYEGVKWTDIVEELMDFHIPIYGSSSTNDEARNHDLLISAGINWHMFGTIDILKYSTGDTLHLSLEPMLQMTPENMIFAEQMDIPGVPKPDYGQPGSYGIIENSNIGYIYIYNHLTGTINQIFLEAAQNLYNTDGLIIDLRADVGGFIDNNLNSGLDLLINEKITELKYVTRCSPTELYSLCDYSQNWFDFTPNPQTFYSKPIAVLIGPKCSSLGDWTAYRFKSFPNVRFLGQTSAAAVGTSTGYYDYPGLPGNYNGWVMYTQDGDSYLPNNPNQYLSGVHFPLDKDVWLTKEDAANGFDTVVEEAVSWINNLSYCFNATIDKYYTQDDIEINADVKNPNNHTLSIIAYILNNDIVIDSLDCTIVENKISETWSVPGNNEDFYSVTIKTKDSEDSTVHTLPNIVRFTTAGPVVLDSIAYVKGVYDYYNLKPYVRNEGITLTITGAKIKLYCDDPWVYSISPNYYALPDIEPDLTVGCSGWINVSYIDSLFPGYFNIKAEITQDGFPFWIDSLQIIVTGVEDKEFQQLAFNLEQNYPNPFNPTTTIGFGIQNKSNVKITILNAIGEEVAVVLNEERETGFHQVEFSAANLPSGIYFYQLKAGSFVETKKMILLK
jgi:hypothetical protein